MVAYTNFYETVKEANMRLRNTVILYDKEPYFVLGVAGHKADGIYRIYMEKLGEHNLEHQVEATPLQFTSPDHGNFGPSMDKYLEEKPNSRIIRKMMNSPLFNKFRPFPLGMVNTPVGAIYCQVSPTRKVEQGLTQNKVRASYIAFDPARSSGMNYGGVSYCSRAMRDTIVGAYPTFKEAWDLLSDPTVSNNSIAFSRDFALLRGPLSMIFLVYKTDVIGVFVEDGVVNIAPKFNYTKEVVELLGLFSIK